MLKGEIDRPNGAGTLRSGENPSRIVEAGNVLKKKNTD
jgi:hypothetical protein